MTKFVFSWDGVRQQLRAVRLRTRLSLLLTLLTAGMVLVLAAVWLSVTRDAIREEVEAASRVTLQWLHALEDTQGILDVSVDDNDEPSPADMKNSLGSPVYLDSLIKKIGRIRANQLEIRQADGGLMYQSPPSRYKVGREAPAWFAGWLSPNLPPQVVPMGDWQLVVTPDASRAILDAWDQGVQFMWVAMALCVLMFAASQWALARALHPLQAVMNALTQTGAGHFATRLDTRLPVFADGEMGRLARTFNGMADRLQEAVRDNVRLEHQQDFAVLLQREREAERQAIARELHDDTAQCVTAVRALAGSLQLGACTPAQTHERAGLILQATGQLQDSVRCLLQRLHPQARWEDGSSLLSVVQRSLAEWHRVYPQFALTVGGEEVAGFPAGPSQDNPWTMTVLRMMQESLTNIVRHAHAQRIVVLLELDQAPSGEEWLVVTVDDDGCGGATLRPAGMGGGYGLHGMQERAVLLGGDIWVGNRVPQGSRVQLRLPCASHPVFESMWEHKA